MNIMHAMASDARTTQAPKRRFYSPDLKVQVVSACAQPGASIAAVAMQHGINANIVHRWLREHSQGTLINRPQTFVPVTLSGATEPAALPLATGDIRIEVKRTNTSIVVHGCPPCTWTCAPARTRRWPVWSAYLVLPTRIWPTSLLTGAPPA